MTYIKISHNGRQPGKKYGAIFRYYAWEVKNVWNKELHSSRQKKIRYIGKLTVDNAIFPETISNLMQAYDGKCPLCNERKPLTVDHIHPSKYGLDNSEANLRLICLRCNQERKISKVA